MRTCCGRCNGPLERDYDRYCRACRSAYNADWKKRNSARARGYAKIWRDGQRERGRCRVCTRGVCEFSSDNCLLHYLARRARKALGRQTLANARILMDVFERQGGRCPYTGRELNYGTAQIDHVNPRSTHGLAAFTADNIEWVDPDVNRAKSGMSRPDFLALCQDIAQWASRPECAA
jgi:hypothetical protein